MKATAPGNFIQTCQRVKECNKKLQWLLLVNLIIHGAFICSFWNIQFDRIKFSNRNQCAYFFHRKTSVASQTHFSIYKCFQNNSEFFQFQQTAHHLKELLQLLGNNHTVKVNNICICSVAEILSPYTWTMDQRKTLLRRLCVSTGFYNLKYKVSLVTPQDCIIFNTKYHLYLQRIS